MHYVAIVEDAGPDKAIASGSPIFPAVSQPVMMWTKSCLTLRRRWFSMLKQLQKKAAAFPVRCRS
jgi:hypothetical protein